MLAEEKKMPQSLYHFKQQAVFNVSWFIRGWIKQAMLQREFSLLRKKGPLSHSHTTHKQLSHWPLPTCARCLFPFIRSNFLCDHRECFYISRYDLTDAPQHASLDIKVCVTKHHMAEGTGWAGDALPIWGWFPPVRWSHQRLNIIIIVICLNLSQSIFYSDLGLSFNDLLKAVMVAGVNPRGRKTPRIGQQTTYRTLQTPEAI